MNNQEFIAQAHGYIDGCYREFEGYQQAAEGALNAFHQLCAVHGITYFLAFGTLLGAVRDQDHIPWDYDIDVAVPYHQKDKLIQALQTRLGDDYYYAYYDNVPNYPASCLRVCPKGYSFTALHVDVFFLVGCPDGEKQRARFMKGINRASYLRGVKYGPDWFPRAQDGSKLGRLIKAADALRARLIPAFACKREIRYMEQYPFGGTKYCCFAGELRYGKIYETEWFRAQEEITVGGRTLCVPAGHDAYLKALYGNYMEYLPIDKRFDEFYTMLKLIQKRNRGRIPEKGQ